MALRILTEHGKDTFIQPTCGKCHEIAKHIGEGSTVWVRSNSETNRQEGWADDFELFGKIEVLCNEAFLYKEEDGVSGRTHLTIYVASVYDENRGFVPGHNACDFFLTY